MDFALLALPRSGTTWAANWLMDGNALCLHDPMMDYSLLELEEFSPGRTWGVSCTGLWLVPEYVKMQDCPVVLIERDIGQCNASLRSLGLPEVPHSSISRFNGIRGERFHYMDLFNPKKAERIWNILRPDTPFDAQRHKILSEMCVQPRFATLTPRRDVIDDFINRLNA